MPAFHHQHPCLGLHAPHTRQRSLVFSQVEDFMEVSLLGAVEAASVFVFAQARGRAGDAAA